LHQKLFYLILTKLLLPHPHYRYKPAAAYDFLRNGSESNIDWSGFKGMARVAIAEQIWGVESGSELADEYRLNVVKATVEVADESSVPFVEGAEEGLTTLSRYELPMAAVTSSNRDIYTAYDRILDLERFFGESVAYGEAEHNKPEPHPYILAAGRLGVATGSSLVVEDSGSGIKAGLAAGARVMGIATTMDQTKLHSLGVHYAAEDWRDLVSQVDTLLVRTSEK
jgi:HAD superfamily hydrolase (TIGR01509 family)